MNDDYIREPPGGIAILDEGETTTDASPLRNEFGELFDYGDWDDPDIIVSIDCDCGFSNNFAGPRYRNYFEVLQDDPLIVRCHHCNDTYRARLVQKGEPRYPLVVECFDPVVWVSAEESREPPRNTGDTTKGLCKECGQPLTDADHQTGPDAPEVGWEYYDCPDCRTKTHPDALLNDE